MAQRRVRTLWTDLNGLTHGRYIPSARFDHATHHAVTTMAMSPEGEILPIAGYAADVGFPDLVGGAARRRRGGRAGSRTPTWRSASCGTATASRWRCARGARWRGPSTAGGRSASSRSSASSSSCTCSSPTSRSSAAGGPPAVTGHRVYGVGLGGDPTGLALEFFDAVEAMEIELEGVLTEFSPGQMEINLTYGPALAAADAAQLVKEMTPRGRRPARVPGDVPRPARRACRSAPGCTSTSRWSRSSGGANAFARPVGSRRPEHDRPPVHRRADRPPRGRGRAVGAVGQQLQAVDAGTDRRLLGQLGARQPLQHVPRPGRAGRGDAHREPHAVRHGQPVPGARRRR